MRKFMVFALVALVVVALSVPAFASELNTYNFPIVGGSLGDFNAVVPAPPAGAYNVVVYDANNNVIGETVSDVTYTGGYYYLNVDGNYNGTVVKLDMTITNDLSLEYVYYGDLLEVDDGNVIGPIAVNGKVVFTLIDSDPVPVGDSLSAVFSGIGTYLIGAFASLTAIFWTGTSLTFLGVLATLALAVAIILLAFYIITNLW